MTPQDVKTFFDAHWTVRKYKTFEMPQDHVDVILHAAQRAPTDATAQMYSFIRIEKNRQRLAELSNNAHIATASLAFVVCADVHRLAKFLELHDAKLARIPLIANHFGIGDAVMAGQNLLIAAEMLGYRGCWIGGIFSALDEISQLLELPEGVVPFAALTIGVPDEAPSHRPRIARELVFHTDTYQQPTHEQLVTSHAAMAPITARGNWSQTLARYFAKDGTMEKREIVLKSLLERHLGL